MYLYYDSCPIIHFMWNIDNDLLQKEEIKIKEEKEIRIERTCEK
jgi:hypothetical protein